MPRTSAIWTLEDWLLKDGATGMVRVVPKGTPGAKQARLDTRPIAVRDGLTLTEVVLYTGRAHQIRVQHAHAGLPLWGDARYGGGRPGQQIALWAASLALQFTGPGRIFFQRTGKGGQIRSTGLILPRLCPCDNCKSHRTGPAFDFQLECQCIMLRCGH